MIRRTKYAVLVVCLASTLCALPVRPHAASSPDPFALFAGRAHAPRSMLGKLANVQLTWPQAPRTQSFCLLFLACLCLVALEVKVSRRKDSKQSRLAESLADGLRAGVLDFDEPRRPAAPLWCLWVDPEPEESPEAEPAPEQFVSRYRLLGYHEEAPRTEVAVVSIRQFGVDHDPVPFDRNDDLIRGIPREYLKPRALLEAAAGDDPGEGIPDLDLIASPA